MPDGDVLVLEEELLAELLCDHEGDERHGPGLRHDPGLEELFAKFASCELQVETWCATYRGECSILCVEDMLHLPPFEQRPVRCHSLHTESSTSKQ